MSALHFAHRWWWPEALGEPETEAVKEHACASPGLVTQRMRSLRLGPGPEAHHVLLWIWLSSSRMVRGCCSHAVDPI